jgi:phosphatidylglycerol lysyltransferase
MQPNLACFMREGVGYIAGQRFSHPVLSRKPILVALSNPVADTADHPALLDALLQRQPRCVFVQINYDFAALLHEKGFKVYPLGVESDVPLAGFDLRGKARAKLRQWRNKCIREGVEVTEGPITAQDPGEVAALSRDWLKRKGGAEKNFLTRPLQLNGEEGMRYFWARQNGRLVGFAGMDPMYRGGRVEGYYHNYDRLLGEAPNGTSAYIALTAAEAFRKEGVSTLALGLSPLAGLENEFDNSPLLQRASSLIFEYGNTLYPFKGNVQHKRKFDPRRIKSYVAGNVSALQIMFAASAACGLELKNGRKPSSSESLRAP